MSGLRAFLAWEVALVWLSRPVSWWVRHSGSWTSTLFLVVFIAGFMTPRLWSPVRAVYFDASTLTIPTIHMGDEVTAILDRAIHRDFQGQWESRVWNVLMQRAVGVCERSGGGPYRASALLPEPLTIDWLIGPECAQYLSNTPGFYQVTVTWFVHVPVLGPIPDDVVSNIFEVTQ